MAEAKSTLVVIPARIGSTRLKEKPLRKINGVPLVTHVCLRALEADIGPVILSSDDERVLGCAPRGARLMLAKQIPEERCGSDRVAHASEVTTEPHEFVINLQGDLPFIDPQILIDLAHVRSFDESEMVTVRCQLEGQVVIEDGSFWRQYPQMHVGLYAFTKDSLRYFANRESPESEIVPRLEGNRAVEYGMTIRFMDIDHMPLEVNTEADLKHANLIAECIWRSEDVRPSDSRLEPDP